MKKYLIFAISIFCFVCFNVKASNLSMQDFGFSIGNSSNLPFRIDLLSGASVKHNFTIYIDGTDYTKYNYLVFDACLYNPISVNVTGTCNSSCFNNGEVSMYHVGTSCEVSNYGTATLYRFQVKVNKFEDYTGAGEFKAVSQFNFKNNNSYWTLGDITNLYLSDEDVLSSLINQQKQQNSLDNINNNLNDLESKQDQTNQKLDNQNKLQQEQNDFLMDDTAPDVDIGNLGTVSGLLPAGPIDSLLNIPFKFLSVLTSSLSGTCSPLSGTFVFDSTITIPCFNDVFYKEVPDYLMNFLSLIPAGFILIKYFKHLYKKVERATSLETTSDDEWGAI